MEASASTDSLASQFALRVALQTMKERCLVLQRRLIAVEEENQQLRERVDTEQRSSGSHDNAPQNGAAELLQLRFSVAELNRQKAQLSEHINMVSTENRKLWSRLSQIAKEQGRAPAEPDCTMLQETEAEANSSPRGANQNLIRSKTFTQHSPNPNLRHKLIANEGGQGDNSMEEVTLNTYEENAALDAAAEVELGFAYLNVDEGATPGEDADEADFNLEAKKCMEGMQQIRRQVVQQQQQLSSALTALESRIALQPCAECAEKAKKPEMADKSLETDDSLSEIRQPPRPSVTTAKETNTPQHLNIIEEKIKADALTKVCPMCGKMFSDLVPFESFQQHVEVHFIDDRSDIDGSLEHTYELISHTVGDF